MPPPGNLFLLAGNYKKKPVNARDFAGFLGKQYDYCELQNNSCLRPLPLGWIKSLCLSTFEMLIIYIPFRVKSILIKI